MVTNNKMIDLGIFGKWSYETLKENVLISDKFVSVKEGSALDLLRREKEPAYYDTEKELRDVFVSRETYPVFSAGVRKDLQFKKRVGWCLEDPVSVLSSVIKDTAKYIIDSKKWDEENKKFYKTLTKTFIKGEND